MKKFFNTLRACLFLSLAGLLLVMSACKHSDPAGQAAHAGNPQRIAPDFTIKDLSGRGVSLSDFKGQLVIVGFWASWCPPCRSSIPELVTLQERYGSDGLTIIGISVDKPEILDDEALKAFVQEYRVNYPILRDEGVINVVTQYFGGERLGIPAIFFIDREGFMVERRIGYIEGALEETLKKYL